MSHFCRVMLLSIGCAAVSSGCAPASQGGADGGLADGGGGGDAGVAIADAGSAQRDAGSAQHDAGSAQRDAGSAQRDAGSAQHDAGSAQHDAGSAQHDAGSAQRDAGSAQHDAGATTDDAGSAQHDAGGTTDDAGDLVRPSIRDVAVVSVTDADGDGEPSTAIVTDTLACTYTWRDSDADPSDTTLEWRDGNGMLLGTDAALSGAFTKGDTIVCGVSHPDVIPDDTQHRAQIIIGNAAPAARDVENQATTNLDDDFDPQTATPGDKLSCAYTFDDVDSDLDQSTIRWRLEDGTEVGQGPTFDVSVDSSTSVYCEVTPSDGETTGVPVVATPIWIRTTAEVYPAPADRRSDLWRVEVKIGDAWQDAGAMMHARMSQDPHYHGTGYTHTTPAGPTGAASPRVHFATIGVEEGHALPVRITRLSGDLLSASVLPEQYGITPIVSTTSRSITFELRVGQKVYVATNGQDFDTLFLFANPKEASYPDAPNVYRFAPGVHEVGVDWSPPPTVDTLVIPGGAFVIGSIDITISPSSIFRVEGNGVLSGEFDTYENVKYINNDPNQVRPYPEKIDAILLHTDYNTNPSHDIRVQGITALASPFYNFHFASSAEKHFSHVAILSPWTYNTDGFNGKSNLTVTDCFAHNNDDTLHGEYVNGGPIYAANNVLAGRNAFLIGYGYFSGNKTSYATFEHNALILQKNRVPFRARIDARPHATPGVFDPATDVVVENQIYRDMVIDDVLDRLVYLGIEHTTWGHGAPAVTGPVYGNIRNIRFENIEVRQRPNRKGVIFGVDATNTIGEPDAPIVFRDLYIEGVHVTEQNAGEFFEVGAFAYVAFE